MLMIISFLLLIYIIYRLYRYFIPYPNIDPQGKYVLITGCDSGIGHELPITLDKQGFHVFASVHNPRSEALLRSCLSSRSTVFVLDITKMEDINAAYDLIKTKTDTLYALVNNAGVATGGHIDWISMDFIRTMMDINYFGHVAMTKKFLPLLIAKQGSRVINVGSVAGYLPVQSMSAYSGAKHALEAFSDCLRQEMRSWGLYVSVIQPGFVKTPMTNRYHDELQNVWENASVEVRERWGDDYYNDQSKYGLIRFLCKFQESLDQTIAALQHAIMNTVPQHRYRTGWQSLLVDFPLSFLPSKWIDYIILNWGVKGIPPIGIIKQRNT